MSKKQPVGASPFCMKRLFTLTLLGMLGLGIEAAHAAKMASTVTPESMEAHGFLMKVENQTDGTVQFTLIRELAKARQFPADSGLQISRYTTLRVSDQSGLRARCELAPDTRQQGAVTYRFAIAGDCIAQSSLQVAEDDDYQDPTREHLIGGGTHYSFALALFAKVQKP